MQKVAFAVLGCISLVMLIIFSFLAVKEYKKEKMDRKILSPLHIFTLGVFTSAFFMFLPVFFYSKNYAGEVCPVRILMAFRHALRLFLLDTEFEIVEEAISELPGMIRIPFALLGASVYIIAPFLTFGNILALFKNIRDDIRFRLHNKRPFYIFSELNERSISLAESVFTQAKEKKPIIVFTDVFIKNEEDNYELYLRAKDVNAIVFKKDLSRINIGKKDSKIRIFLMDNNETGNLQTLSTFRYNKKIKNLKKTDEIYIFGKDERCQFALNSIRGELEEDLKENVPAFVIVDGTRNLIYNLLKDKPLFSAKSIAENQGDEAEKQLRIAIFGSGEIGTEMFLATYWCGQMLDYKLMITVVSKEKKSDFVARIKHINPDIFESSNAESDLLNVYSDGIKKAKVYFQFEYVETDVRLDGLYSKMTAENINGCIVDSDYFVVAFGTDGDNLEIADIIGRLVSIHKAEKNEPDINPIPIAYSVFDDELNSSLKNGGHNEYRFVDMFPFASLSETYKYGNITFDGIKEAASRINDTYHKKINDKLGKDDKYHKDSYSYWADVARAIHIQYKAFSIGKNVDEYKDWAYKVKDKKAENDKDDKEIRARNRLAWLEHRRWNAFMRARGFRKPSISEEKGYISLLPDVPADSKVNQSKHKSIPLKLHPCLVECDENEMNGDVFEKDPNEKFDLLDEVSRRVKYDYPKKSLHGYDFKQYDFPDGDF